MLSPFLARLMAPAAARLLRFGDEDFTVPAGEAAIVAPDSISWRLFRNPVTLYIGGVAAVLLELGEPRVRAGVWQYSSFRSDPAERMRRTGLGAMITVYGARSRFEAYVRQVNAIHARIAGMTDAGQSFRADDPELLRWVQVTASFAFLAAYRTYVHELSAEQRDLYFAEASVGAAYYGVVDAPRDEAAVGAVFDQTQPLLEPSAALREFLQIQRSAPILPLPLRPLQRVITRAAIGLLPPRLRQQIGLSSERAPNNAERRLLSAAAQAAERMHIPGSPWAQACARLGLEEESLAGGRLSPANAARLRS